MIASSCSIERYNKVISKWVESTSYNLLKVWSKGKKESDFDRISDLSVLTANSEAPKKLITEKTKEYINLKHRTQSSSNIKTKNPTFHRNSVTLYRNFFSKISDQRLKILKQNILEKRKKY